MVLFLSCHIDVIRAIGEFAFKTSPYPVVLSIENHCSLVQQEIMADIMVDLLKEKLLLPDFLTVDDANLPSPEAMKYKILVKGKRPTSVATTAVTATEDDDDDDEEDEEDDDDDDEDAKNTRTDKDGAKPKTKKQLLKEQQRASANAGAKVHKEKIHPKLASITYLGTCHCKSFDKEKSDSIPPDKMTSYAEGKTKKYVKNREITEGWIEHNKRHLR